MVAKTMAAIYTEVNENTTKRMISQNESNDVFGGHFRDASQMYVKPSQMVQSKQYLCAGKWYGIALTSIDGLKGSVGPGKTCEERKGILLGGDKMQWGVVQSRGEVDA